MSPIHGSVSPQAPFLVATQGFTTITWPPQGFHGSWYSLVTVWVYFPRDPAQTLSAVTLISDKGCRNQHSITGGARSFTSHGTFQLNLCKLSRHICVRLTQGRVQGGEADPESIHWTKTESGAGDLRLQKFQKPVVGASGRRLRTTREETRMCEGLGLGSPCTTPRDSAWLAPPVLALLTTLAVLLLKTFCWVYCSKNLLCLPTCLLIHLSHGSGFKRPSLFPTPYCLG